MPLLIIVLENSDPVENPEHSIFDDVHPRVLIFEDMKIIWKLNIFY